MKNKLINRREFITAGTSIAAIAACNASVQSKNILATAANASDCQTPLPLIATAPALQNLAETSVSVVFAVNDLASGWVEVADNPDMKEVTRHYSGGHGLMEIDEKIAQIRIKGLRPATRYWYRIGADRISYGGGYKMSNLGAERNPTVYTFQTAGANANSSFCVICDTHENRPAIGAAFKRIAELSPTAVVWNGDATNTTETEDKAIEVFLSPHPDYPAYSSSIPYLFVPGNHDYRGRFARNLEKVVMWRDPSERDSEFAELGRNFVLRLGEVALIGLDTGEDKMDTNPAFAGIFRMREYRELQQRWLAKAIQSPAVKTAKFKIACCHIPLFDPSPNANPGDVAPADSDPRYSTNFAMWQRTCATLWGPQFVKAGIQLVIAAHQHEYRYDEATAERPWAQMVGAGFAMVIDAKVHGERLHVRAYDAAANRLVDERIIG